MKKCRLAPAVETELDEIWSYIATNSGNTEIANRVIENITERFWLLAQNPHIGRLRDSDLRPGLKSFPSDNSIIYRIENNIVLILHVVHGSRNVQALLG